MRKTIDRHQQQQQQQQRTVSTGSNFPAMEEPSSSMEDKQGRQPSFNEIQTSDSNPYPTETIRTTNDDPDRDTIRSRQPIRSLAAMEREYGQPSIEDTILQYQRQLQELEEQITTFNNHKPFNILSPKQVSLVLFGEADKSTNRFILEGMATHSKMADLILQYRTIHKLYTKWNNKLKLKQTGARVTSVVSSKQQQQQEQLQQQQSTTNVMTNHTENDNDNDEDPLILIDTSAYIFRAYWSMPPLHRKDGTPVGAVLGFCNMLNKIVMNRLLQLGTNDELQPPRLVLVLDSGPTFRQELYPDYKAHRPEIPMDLVPQFEFIKYAANEYGIDVLEAPGYEADDVIATLSTLASAQGIPVNILSSDKDLMQLITSPNGATTGQDHGWIQMIDPITMARIDHQAVMEKWGVSSSQLGDLLALAGDSADNVPGVPGIGPKTAAILLQEYGTLPELYKNLDTIAQKGRRDKLRLHQDQAFLSKQLVELERHVPFDRITFPSNKWNGDVRNLRMQPLDPDRLVQFYKEMGFHSIQERFKVRFEKYKHAMAARGEMWKGSSNELFDAAATTLTAPSPSSNTDINQAIVSTPASEAEKPEKSSNHNNSAGRSRFTPRKKAEIPKPDDYKDVPF